METRIRILRITKNNQAWTKIDIGLKMDSGGNLENFIDNHLIGIFIYYNIHTTKIL